MAKSTDCCCCCWRDLYEEKHLIQDNGIGIKWKCFIIVIVEVKDAAEGEAVDFNFCVCVS